MTAGPATRMHEALRTIAEEDEGRAGNVAARAGIDITPATLEAMDAAAALVEAEITPRRTLEDCHVDFEGEIGGEPVALILEGRELTVEAERALAVLLIQRAIQRREEAGHGA